jgi:hypothetical protein
MNREPFSSIVDNGLWHITSVAALGTILTDGWLRRSCQGDLQFPPFCNENRLLAMFQISAKSDLGKEEILRLTRNAESFFSTRCAPTMIGLQLAVPESEVKQPKRSQSTHDEPALDSDGYIYWPKLIPHWEVWLARDVAVDEVRFVRAWRMNNNKTEWQPSGGWPTVQAAGDELLA